MEGELVEQEFWSETMAQYLEKVQWRVRPAGLVDGPPLGNDLPVDIGAISEGEVTHAVMRLKRGRAAGPDEIPAEYWKAVAAHDGGLRLLTELCNLVWEKKRIPSDWHTSVVTAIYKKGAVDDCGNYRPISLLSVAYKLFASIILSRLKRAGAEDRLTDTQYGFRSKRGTSDAIFAARRYMETARAQRNGQVSIVALDWKKAFDSINPAALMCALQRFGVPPAMLEIISDIYTKRSFRVKDGDRLSSDREQASGISQGCPLSPFLFTMLMTVVMRDAAQNLEGTAKEACRKGGLATVLYADDTLLVGTGGPELQDYLASVAEVGKKFGLELHMDKFQMIQICCNFEVGRPDGQLIKRNAFMHYLGTILAADGTLKGEIGRKLAAAWGEFQKLRRAWHHTNLSKRRKLEVFQAVITSRALYGLEGAWLNAAERRRLDGFQAKCLRQILGIKSAFLSRVPNKVVLEKAGSHRYTSQLLKAQLLLLGRIARAPEGDPLRALTFRNSSLRLATDKYVRRVGRPRNEWAAQLLREARLSARGQGLEDLIKHESLWRAAVTKYCTAH